MHEICALLLLIRIPAAVFGSAQWTHNGVECHCRRCRHVKVNNSIAILGVHLCESGRGRGRERASGSFIHQQGGQGQDWGRRRGEHLQFHVNPLDESTYMSLRLSQTHSHTLGSSHTLTEMAVKILDNPIW